MKATLCLLTGSIRKQRRTLKAFPDAKMVLMRSDGTVVLVDNPYAQDWNPRKPPRSDHR